MSFFQRNKRKLPDAPHGDDQKRGNEECGGGDAGSHRILRSVVGPGDDDQRVQL